MGTQALIPGLSVLGIKNHGSVILQLAADHPWRLDITSLAGILAACAGILAACGTFVLAWFTWRLARETTRLASETGDDIRAQWRPVLVADASGVRVDLGKGEGVIGLRNVGRGPALNTIAMVSYGSATMREIAEIIFGTIAPDAVATRTVGGLVLESDEDDSSWLRCSVTATYSDLAGQDHETEVEFLEPEQDREDGARARRAAPS